MARYGQGSLFGQPAQQADLGLEFSAAGQAASAPLPADPAPAGPKTKKRGTPLPSRDPDLVAGLKGDWAALTRVINERGSASSILADLIDGRIPSWNLTEMKVENPCGVMPAREALEAKERDQGRLFEEGLQLPPAFAASRAREILVLFARGLEEVGNPSNLHIHEIFTEQEIKEAEAIAPNEVLPPNEDLQASPSARVRGSISDLYRSILAGATSVNQDSTVAFAAAKPQATFKQIPEFYAVAAQVGEMMWNKGIQTPEAFARKLAEKLGRKATPQVLGIVWMSAHSDNASVAVNWTQTLADLEVKPAEQEAQTSPQTAKDRDGNDIRVGDKVFFGGGNAARMQAINPDGTVRLSETDNSQREFINEIKSTGVPCHLHQLP